VLFPTVAFALFFCVAFLANWLLRPKPAAWRTAMIALSFFFYGYWDDRFIFLLAGSIMLNYLCARWIAARRASGDGPATDRGRLPLAVGVAANLVVLGVFKYYGFFAASAANALGLTGPGPEPLLDLVLPVGISFYTFQAIGYLVDLHRRDLDGPMSLSELGVFLSFFPQLVAGPIVRATDMIGQIRHRPDPRTVPAGEAFLLITQGLVKKVVISSYLAAEVVDPVFDVPGQHSRLETLAAVYGYAVQIYADFSGYTDIAIGCALLLGFRFPVNFASPYRARSVGEFWHRWHISLSTWLRDYLYIPLGGNRRGRLTTYRNLAATMVLGGLWHGAAWTFVGWGAIHGAALVVERAVSEWWRPLGLPAPAVAVGRWLMTFHLVCLSWVFFRADSFSRAFEVLGRLVGPTSWGPAFPWLAAAAVTVPVATQFLPATAIDRARLTFAQANPVTQVAALAGLLTVIDALGPQGVAPFIYFQF
jgi:D-alanyl-lipoteichoic acid acyltransferase DltB (MBOAT superfamily)